MDPVNRLKDLKRLYIKIANPPHSFVIYFKSFIHSGLELSYCQTDRRQCCSNTFLLDRREQLKRQLLESLKDELSANGELLDSIVSRLEECEYYNHCRYAHDLLSLYSSRIYIY